jgi:hypothetical protein
MKKTIIVLSTVIILCAITTTSVGLFFESDESSYYLENVYGDTIEISGEGLYATESVFKAPINKGTDAVILFIVIPLFILTLVFYNRDKLKVRLLHLGLLTCLLYYSASIAFGVSYNILFLVYILLFSASLFTFIIGIIDITKFEIKESFILNLNYSSRYEQA